MKIFSIDYGFIDKLQISVIDIGGKAKSVKKIKSSIAKHHYNLYSVTSSVFTLKHFLQE